VGLGGATGGALGRTLTGVRAGESRAGTAAELADAALDSGGAGEVGEACSGGAGSVGKSPADGEAAAVSGERLVANQANPISATATAPTM